MSTFMLFALAFMDFASMCIPLFSRLYNSRSCLCIFRDHVFCSGQQQVAAQFRSNFASKSCRPPPSGSRLEIIMKGPRRERPIVSRLDVERMVELWSPLARLKDPGFGFDGAAYTASHRSSPDVEGLAMHAEALQHLLREAPSAFPAHAAVVAIMLRLHSEHSILGSGLESRFTSRAANLAAEQWRLMCKHVYTLEVTKAAVEDKKVTALIDLVVIKTKNMSEPTSSCTATLAEPRSKTKTPVEDEVVLCSWVCQCRECLDDAPVIEISDEEDATTEPEQGDSQDMSEDDLPDMKELDHIPNPSIGGQRAETMKKPAAAKPNGAKPSHRMTRKAACPAIADKIDPTAPVHVVVPEKRPMAFIRIGKFYLGGISRHHGQQYADKVRAVADAVQRGEIKTITEARNRLERMKKQG